jgi:hypothetical protein
MIGFIGISLQLQSILTAEASLQSPSPAVFTSLLLCFFEFTVLYKMP